MPRDNTKANNDDDEEGVKPRGPDWHERNPTAADHEAQRARMRVIERLQRNRPEVVHLFQEMVELIPEGVQLEKLTQKGSKITFTGKTQSNARVSSFMRALDGSEWFTKPELDVIQSKSSKGGSRLRSFTMRIQQDNPADESGKEEEG